MPSDAPDWADTPYVKIYQSLGRDYPTVWRDPATLGAYVRLLAAADAVWPAPAELPRGVSTAMVQRLETLGIVETVDDDWFRFHGLDRERGMQAERSARGRLGGLARAAKALRINGQFASEAASDAGASVTTSAAGETAYLNGATPTSDGWASNASPNQPTVLGKETLASSGSLPSTNPPATAGANAGTTRNPARPPRVPYTRLADPPGTNPCREPEAHTVEFRYAIGVGWRCPQCDAAEDARGQRSFSDRVADHGGWVPEQGRKDG